MINLKYNNILNIMIDIVNDNYLSIISYTRYKIHYRDIKYNIKTIHADIDKIEEKFLKYNKISNDEIIWHNNTNKLLNSIYKKWLILLIKLENNNNYLSKALPPGP